MANTAWSANYFVSPNGTGNGTTEGSAWGTLDQVNSFTVDPKDHVLFQRDGEWRGQLIPQEGVVYSFYGDGENNPQILNSVQKRNEDDWTEEEDNENVWTINPQVLGDNLLPQPFNDNWEIYVNSSSAEVIYEEDETGFVIQSIAAGTAHQDIQVYAPNGIPIENETWYRLSFRAKSSTEIYLNQINLIKNVADWDNYADLIIKKSAFPDVLRVDSTFSDYEVFFRTNAEANDARTSFLLGTIIPDGEILEVRNLAMHACDYRESYITELNCDIGNIIFDDDSCGWKVFNKDDLTKQGDFYYDPDTQRIYLYSENNPAYYYQQNIELARTENIVQIEDVNHPDGTYIKGIDLKYGGAHGIFITNSSYVYVTGCKISYIGGGKQFGDQNLRYGNGVEGWNNVHDMLIEKCFFLQVYDAAFTNQSLGENISQFNITFKNNISEKCGYGYEFFSKSTDSNNTTHNILLTNNTIVDSGYGWGWEQRPDKRGIAICVSENRSLPPDGSPFIEIKNSIFSNSRGSSLFFYWGEVFESLDKLVLSNNCYHKPSGNMIEYIDGNSYQSDEFSYYQTATGKDEDSIVSDPLLDEYFYPQEEACLAKGIGALVTSPEDEDPENNSDTPAPTETGSGGGGGCFISSM